MWVFDCSARRYVSKEVRVWRCACETVSASRSLCALLHVSGPEPRTSVETVRLDDWLPSGRAFRPVRAIRRLTYSQAASRLCTVSADGMPANGECAMAEQPTKPDHDSGRLAARRTRRQRPAMSS